MKLAIATRADDNIKEMSDLTHPVIKRYAKKWGCDFIVLDKESEVHRCHYRILELKDLLNTYDRILSVDTDIVLNKDIKNPFEVVPLSMIGAVYEDVGSRQGKRRQVIRQIQDRFGYVGWESGYINTGFFLVSQMHAPIFEKINGQLWNGWGFDDAHLGYQIAKNKFPIYSLHWRWNNMTMFCEPWNGSPDRFDSFVIHYAGVGRFGNKFKSRMHNIRHDFNKIWEGVKL